MLQNSGQKRAIFLRSAITCVLLAILAVLIWFSLHLAAMRIFDADECRNAMMTRNVATGHFGAGDLFPFLLSSMARSTAHSIEILASCRFVMAEIFWLNIFLL